MFSEIYKKSEGGKHKVKFIRKDLYDRVKRIYDYEGIQIICEGYNETKLAEKCYL